MEAIIWRRKKFSQVIQFLNQNNLRIGIIVTDRHKQINKWLQETHPTIKYYYDTWHEKVLLNYNFDSFLVCLHKKLEALSKTKGCELLNEWQRSIISHLYWCVASSSIGNTSLIKAKWLSLENHLHNVHEGYSTEFPNCAHAILPLDYEWRKNDYTMTNEHAWNCTCRYKTQWEVVSYIEQ